MSIYEIEINERSDKGKQVLQYLKENNIKLKDPYRMGDRKALEREIKQAQIEYESGEALELKYEDISKFLGLE